jgi:hypothetical protein
MISVSVTEFDHQAEVSLAEALVLDPLFHSLPFVLRAEVNSVS